MRVLIQKREQGVLCLLKCVGIGVRGLTVFLRGFGVCFLRNAVSEHLLCVFLRVFWAPFLEPFPSL